MYKTKVTKKGQITLPKAIRDKLEIYRGSVVEVKLEKDKIVVEKPKVDIMSLYGAWKDMPDEIFKDFRKEWKKSRLNR